MKIKIIGEVYVKRGCTKKTTKEKGNCAVLDPGTKEQTSCYDDCKTARAAKHATNEEQLDEMSGMAGGAVAFGVSKEELDEMYSTAQVQSTAYSRRGLTIYIRGRKSEHEGYIEKSNYQGLRNVPDNT